VGGGKTATASTKGELDDALSRARNAREVHVIEIKIPRDDVSPQLARIGREVAKVRGWKKPDPVAKERAGRTRLQNSKRR
jgi:TPP-dependent 2-oxoacid decarboxylase